MSHFDLGAALLLTAAVIDLANNRWIGPPPPVCLLPGAIGLSIASLAIHPFIPQRDLTGNSGSLLAAIDLPHFLFEGVSAFFLFADSLHISVDELWTNRRTIPALAAGRVIVSTVLFGILLLAVTQQGRVLSHLSETHSFQSKCSGLSSVHKLTQCDPLTSRGKSASI